MIKNKYDQASEFGFQKLDTLQDSGEQKHRRREMPKQNGHPLNPRQVSPHHFLPTDGATAIHLMPLSLWLARPVYASQLGCATLQKKGQVIVNCMLKMS